MNPTRSKVTVTFSRAVRAYALALIAVVAGNSRLAAEPISVPNFSFESQTAPSTYPYVNVNVDSWQKAPEPAYYGPAIGTPYGIPWVGTAGVFLDVNPYVNHDGSQCGYILGFPQVTLYQDSFGATFDVGKAYNLTIGVFGKNTLAPGSTLDLSLYYLDGAGNHVNVAATTVTYSSTAFPTTPPLSLVDYQVNTPLVQAGDPWAGKSIGIQLLSTTPLAMSTGGNWDLDNVRLTAVPEPASLGFLSLAGGCLVITRKRLRQP